MKTLIFLLFFQAIFAGQVTKDTNKSVEFKKESIDNVKENTNDTINSKNVYKFLYEETKQTNDRLVSTVFWALGGVVALALFLMGYNAFYNNKINKDQVKNINKEVDNKIEKVRNEDANKLTSKLEENKKEYEEKIRQKYYFLLKDMDSKLQSLTETYEKQTNAFKESTELQIKTLETSIDERSSNISDAIQIMKDSFEQKLNSTNDQLVSVEKSLRYDFEFKIALFKSTHYYTEAKVWEVVNVPVNVFRSYVFALEEESKINYNSQLTLKLILESLDTVGYVWENDKNTLLSLLNSVKDHDSLVQQILVKLNTIRVDKI